MNVVLGMVDNMIVPRTEHGVSIHMAVSCVPVFTNIWIVRMIRKKDLAGSVPVNLSQPQ